MSRWLVKTTWLEDETEATEHWEVNADNARIAVEEVSMRLKYRPHHIEAIAQSPGEFEGQEGELLLPGQARRLPR
jgi:hypothetical protein